MQIFTFGFTKKSAEEFFEKLRSAGIKRIVDVRLNKNSQLAGFSKRDDLRYFAKQVLGIDYIDEPLLAPNEPMLGAYRKGALNWENYERAFLALMKEREIERRIDPTLLADGCLLCSEDKPHHCHRRLVAEYLKEKWGGVEIQHLI